MSIKANLAKLVLRMIGMPPGKMILVGGTEELSTMIAQAAERGALTIMKSENTKANVGKRPTYVLAELMLETVK